VYDVDDMDAPTIVMQPLERRRGPVPLDTLASTIEEQKRQAATRPKLRSDRKTGPAPLETLATPLEDTMAQAKDHQAKAPGGFDAAPTLAMGAMEDVLFPNHDPFGQDTVDDDDEPTPPEGLPASLDMMAAEDTPADPTSAVNAMVSGPVPKITGHATSPQQAVQAELAMLDDKTRAQQQQAGIEPQGSPLPHWIVYAGIATIVIVIIVLIAAFAL